VNSRPILTLIAALSADGFISRGQGVPWNLPRDKARFRRATDDQWLLIGRRTFEEMHGWFRNHRPLVLTTRKDFAQPMGKAVFSVEEALEVASKQGAREMFVCGGGGAYEAAMPLADRLILTHVDTVLDGGVPFPAFQVSDWHQSSQQAFPADDENPHALAFATYERISRPKTTRRSTYPKIWCEQNRV
jgi:dihydrofolate reductase